MHADFQVTDVDAHYIDSVDDLTPYVDEPHRSRLENTRTVLPGTTGSRNVYGRIERDITEYYEKDDVYKDGDEPDDVAKIMDGLGFDNIVLLSQQMLSFARIRADDERMPVLANAFVDYMLDNVVDPSEGVYTLIPAPYASPEETVELVDRVGDERGIAGLCMVTAGPEPPLGNRRYDQIYEVCERKELPVVFHTGGAGLDQFHVRGYEKFIETHTLGFLMSNMSQLVSIVVQGLPEKFPDLDVVFQESGLAWVPMMMRRLDTEYLKRQSEAPLLEKRPSEYIKDFYFGTQPLEIEDQDYLEEVVREIGVSQLLYASDYPHWDYDDPSAITDLRFLDHEEKAAILAGNAAEVFDV